MVPEKFTTTASEAAALTSVGRTRTGASTGRRDSTKRQRATPRSRAPHQASDAPALPQSVSPPISAGQPDAPTRGTDQEQPQHPDDPPPSRPDDLVPPQPIPSIPQMSARRRKAHGSTEETTDPALVKITVGNLTQSLAVPCPDQVPIISGLLYRGEIGILAASPGTGKTPLVAQVASTTATGTDFLGLSTKVCRVLLIDVESQPQDYRTLLRRQWTALNLDADHVGRSVDLFARGVPDDPNSRELERILRCSNIKKWEWVTNLVQLGQYGLVIVDTVLTFSPFKSGDEEKVRELYAALACIARSASRPAVLVIVHLRKKDRKGQTPTLLEDPMAWTEEILGSIVWSASADVRLGLERVDDHRVAFGGYRRGRGEFPPLILEARHDEHGNPLVWDRCADDAVALHMLTKEQRGYFARIPLDRDLTWKGLGIACGAADSSLSRLKEAAMGAGLLDYDPGRRVYRRRK
jgi:hypothetical protein